MDGQFTTQRIASVAALQRIIDAVPNPIFVKDSKHRWMILNEALTRLIGVSADQLLGKSDFDVFPTEQARVFWERDQNVFVRGGLDENEEQITNAAGEIRTIVTRKTLIKLGNGDDDRYIVGVISDVTAYREAEARAHFLALHDTLTGLANRGCLTTKLRAALADAARAGERVAILCLDLDRFKAVNDLYGHAAGDEVLRIAASRLRGMIRPRDTAARLGGDEFVVLQTRLEDADDAASLATRIVAGLSQEYRLSGKHVATVSSSVGIAVFPDDGDQADILLSRADAALYSIKTNGRNGFAFFHPGLDTDARDRHALEQDIQLALSRHELSIVYQPLCDVGSRRVNGFETLMRWHHPRRGEVPPDRFIAAAESCGAIIPMGAWMLREVCREAATWPVGLRVAVNVSPAQIHHGDIAGIVEQALAETGLDPARLELEVTEGILIRDRDLALRAMRRFKELGVGLVLDDFGTGYSSLSMLSAFPFDRVKVDRSFIRDLSTRPEARAIVRAVLALGHALGMSVVAEGVEEEAQLAELQRQGCDEFQGYLIARPLPIGAHDALTGRSARRPTSPTP